MNQATSTTFDAGDVVIVARLGTYTAAPKRVVCIDYETRTLLVVTDDAYRARDFSKPERIPIADALWMVP